MFIATNKRTVLIIITIITGILIFTAGIGTGYFLTTHLVPSEMAEFEELFQPFYQAWNIIQTQYLEQPVDDVSLMQGAIKGMVESLGDPYTAYMDQEEFLEQNAPLQGEYTGIGAWVDTSGDALIFISPMPDSPAEEAGIKPGDMVVMIDGEDMRSVEPDLVLKRILGPAGTVVHITVQRENETELIEMEIERAVITVPTVDSELLENEIGYIRLYSFGANSTSEFAAAMNELIGNGSESLIVDLRANSGGFVETAVEISSYFLESGTVLIEEWGDGSRDEYTANEKPISTEIPVVILVDGGTASSSEIMAGALQDYDRATLIGTTTFGKGLIQNWIPLVGENGAIRVTIAHWLTPKEQEIQGNGLTPDIVVEFTDEDIQNLNDVQLQSALDYLVNQNTTAVEN